MNMQHIITSSPVQMNKYEFHGHTTTAATSSNTKETKFKLNVSRLPRAVAEYRDFPERPLKLLAEKFGTSPSAIIYQARKAGVPGRKRGRPALLNPTAKHEQIFELVRNYYMAEAARQAGVSRQYVFSLIRHRAPELIKHRTKKNTTNPSPCRQHRPRRHIVVSFRLSDNELNRLRNVNIRSVKPVKSLFDKARAIVLQKISRPDDSVYKPLTIPHQSTLRGQKEPCVSTIADFSEGLRS